MRVKKKEVKNQPQKSGWGRSRSGLKPLYQYNVEKRFD